MPATAPQSKDNHARIDPSFHYVLVGLLILLLGWAIGHLIRHPGFEAVAFLVIVIVLFLLAFKARSYALKVQDRVIRLEERLRMAMLLPEPLRARIPEVSESQIVALRFASDGELAVLVERALNEKLTNKQIKDAVRNWRPDYWRV